MNQNILDAFDNYQIADLNYDVVGICKSLIDWLKILNVELDKDTMFDLEKPENFFKLDPHIPRSDLRTNTRQFLALATKNQKENVEYIKKIKNLYVSVVAAAYVYHLPTDKIIEMSKKNVEYSREDVQKMLLEDNMSPNWIKLNDYSLDKSQYLLL